jgi:hypothetical protein
MPASGLQGGPPLQGRRLPDADFRVSGGGWESWRDSQPGDYMKVKGMHIGQPEGQEIWYIRDPAGKIGTIRSHTVIEHEDGSITVQPSIWDAPDGWHGWLERGLWRSC